MHGGGAAGLDVKVGNHVGANGAAQRVAPHYDLNKKIIIVIPCYVVIIKYNLNFGGNIKNFLFYG